MKKLALVTINTPGVEAVYKLLPYLNSTKNVYQTTLYYKNDTKIKKTNQYNLLFYDKLTPLLNDIWDTFDIILFFLATGIVVRKIAPKLNAKTIDPAVLVMSLDLKQILPLISGHIGGANEFANEISTLIPHCTSFISTATDQTNTLAFDLFAKAHQFNIENIHTLAKVSNSLLNQELIQVVSYPSIIKEIKATNGYNEKLIQFINIVNSFTSIDNSLNRVIISPIPYLINNDNEPLIIKIPHYYLGIGMNRDTSLKALSLAINHFIFEHNLKLEELKGIASFSAKSNEKALIEYSEKYNIPVNFFSEEEINSLTEEFSPSKAKDFFNIKGVAEPTAVLTSKYKTLFLKKHIYHSVTLAAAF